MKKGTLTLNLEHGLGNQLSQYFAGLAYSLEYDLNLKCSHKFPKAGFHDSFLDIRELNLIGDFDKSDNRSLVNVEKLTQFCSHRFPASDKLTGRYYGKGQGYDPNLMTKSGVRRLSGFFHCYYYFDYCQSILPSLTSDQIFPSDFANHELTARVQAPNAISIHIRRGDFLAHSESFGSLGLGYYLGSLQDSRKRVENPNFYIFSDDLKSAHSIIDHLEISNAVFPEALYSLTPLQIIYFLSQSKTLISSNSTFSYWSAVMSNENNYVLMPKPFHRNTDLSEEFLYRPRWKLIDAQFKLD